MTKVARQFVRWRRTPHKRALNGHQKLTFHEALAQTTCVTEWRKARVTLPKLKFLERTGDD